MGGLVGDVGEYVHTSVGATVGAVEHELQVNGHATRTAMSRQLLANIVQLGWSAGCPAHRVMDGCTVGACVGDTDEGAAVVGEADLGAAVSGDAEAGAALVGAADEGAMLSGAAVNGADVMVGPGVSDVGAWTTVSPTVGHTGRAWHVCVTYE